MSYFKHAFAHPTAASPPAAFVAAPSKCQLPPGEWTGTGLLPMVRLPVGSATGDYSNYVSFSPEPSFRKFGWRYEIMFHGLCHLTDDQGNAKNKICPECDTPFKVILLLTLENNYFFF